MDAARGEAATLVGGGAPPIGWVTSLCALALSIAFYAWMLRSPRPIALDGLVRVEGADPLDGLGLALGIGMAGAALLLGVLTVLPSGPLWRGRLVVAAGGLYAAACVPVIGRAGLVLAPALVAVELVLQLRARTPSRPDGLLLALHAGAFAAAVCFFHEWPRYQLGWSFFLRNLAALQSLWL